MSILISLCGIVISNFFNGDFIEEKSVFLLITLVIMPGIFDLFGLTWLDLTTRYIKECHFLFTLEVKINSLAKDPQLLTYEKFIVMNSSSRLIPILKNNYLYYCCFLGVLLFIPLVFVVFLYCNPYLEKVTGYTVAFVFIEIFKFICALSYVKEILYYAEKSKVLSEQYYK